MRARQPARKRPGRWSFRLVGEGGVAAGDGGFGLAAEAGFGFEAAGEEGTRRAKAQRVGTGSLSHGVVEGKLLGDGGSDGEGVDERELGEC